MTRIDIHYDGVLYTLPDGDLDTIRARVLEAISTNKPFWLEANLGSGSYRRADLLITPGISITFSGITTGEDLLT